MERSKWKEEIASLSEVHSTEDLGKFLGSLLQLSLIAEVR